MKLGFEGSESPRLMSWHQFPIQHPLASTPMSHLRQNQSKTGSEVVLERITNQSSVAQLHMVLHMPAGGISSVLQCCKHVD